MVLGKKIFKFSRRVHKQIYHPKSVSNSFEKSPEIPLFPAKCTIVSVRLSKHYHLSAFHLFDFDTKYCGWPCTLIHFLIALSFKNKTDYNENKTDVGI